MTTPSELMPCAESTQTAPVPPAVAKAKWIWSQDDPDLTNIWVYARRCFEVRSVHNVYLNISADLRYLAWVNPTSAVWLWITFFGGVGVV